MLRSKFLQKIASSILNEKNCQFFGENIFQNRSQFLRPTGRKNFKVTAPSRICWKRTFILRHFLLLCLWRRRQVNCTKARPLDLEQRREFCNTGTNATILKITLEEKTAFFRQKLLVYAKICLQMLLCRFIGVICTYIDQNLWSNCRQYI
jgi:hypothetical protein